jgi:hypothetical protein
MDQLNSRAIGTVFAAQEMSVDQGQNLLLIHPKLSERVLPSQTFAASRTGEETVLNQ